ncbi:fibronectin type III domain-containing protein [Candidatus Peregrinibacteria bacterium]|nr:MAG: fibronectin type III domain-containing protein [Candidatus Peregrinibacteria bacterium]
MKTKRILISALSSLMFAAQLSLAAGVPGNIGTVTAIPLDHARVQLSWNAVLDETGLPVDHYRVYYDTGSYLNDDITQYGNHLDTPTSDLIYIVEGLMPETRYYFSVTGISEDNKESATFSLEAIATTLAAPRTETTADDQAPTVNQVMAADRTHVQVVFSEPVNLPTTGAESAFLIHQQIDTTGYLAVTNAIKDPSDPSGKTVLLTTDPQQANVNYVLVVGVMVKDQSGNPIISGTADTGLFIGSDKLEGQIMMPVMATVDCGDDLNCFVGHLSDCSPALVNEGDDALGYSIELMQPINDRCEVVYTATHHPNTLVMNTDMRCLVPMANYRAADYKAVFTTDDCEGPLKAGYIDISTIPVADTTPPEDVTNLVLSFRRHMEQFIVEMKWTPSINTAKDLVDQMLYMSLDRGANYDAGKSLGPSATNAEVPNLEGGKEYTFKLTTKDASGNESTGLIKAIRLPQTGAGTGLMLMGSGLVALQTLRRKRK